MLFTGKTVSQLPDYNDRQKLKIASFVISTRGWNAHFDYPTLSKTLFLCSPRVGFLINFAAFLVRLQLIFFSLSHYSLTLILKA